MRRSLRLEQIQLINRSAIGDVFKQRPHFLAAERIIIELAQTDPFGAERFVIRLRFWSRVANRFGGEDDPDTRAPHSRRVLDAEDAGESDEDAAFFQVRSNAAWALGQIDPAILKSISK